MQLIVHEILTSVYQTLRPTKNTFVSVVRPHLYIHNNPTGNLKVQICSGDDSIIAESATINMSDITAEIEYHGYVSFYVDASLRKNTNYIFKIVAGGGYSFNESAYCAVCNDYDLRKYSQVVPGSHPWIAPLDIEIWSRSSK